MKKIRISGTDYVTFERSVFRGPRGSDLRDLTLWHQPLSFFPNSNLLRQTRPGPCATFAVLEAEIVLSVVFTSSKVDLWFARLNAALTILERISPTFTFCTEFNHSAQTCDFEITQDRDAALAFLLERDYLDHPQAVLLFTLGIIFASGELTKLQLPSEPFIEADQYAALALVMLLLNGKFNDQAMGKLKANNFVSEAQTAIGIKVLKSQIPGVRGNWLNPQAKLFVCHNINHFITIMVPKDNPDNLIVFDTLREGKVYEIAPQKMNWIQ
jgi:hypothetical protein